MVYELTILSDICAARRDEKKALKRSNKKRRPLAEEQINQEYIKRIFYPKRRQGKIVAHFRVLIF